jgi:mannose-1-phosphate guanylyltransferase
MRYPKQFLDIIGKGPLVLETCDRLSGLVSDEDTVIVLGEAHVSAARDLLQGRDILLVGEPQGRNTAPCMGLGAILAQHRGHRGAAAFLPADHFIQNRSAFVSAMQAAEELALSGGIVTLGIVPTRPETGYGYIRRAKEALDAGGLRVYRISEFVEKPDLATARGYLSSGEYYWNGGIFIATPEAILREIEQHLPRLYDGLLQLKKALGTDGFEAELRRVYQGMEAISFDYGVMEKTQAEVYVVPCECGWSDVGTWHSLYELKQAERDEKGNLSEGEALLVDCNQTYVSSRGGRMVACLGLSNCLVVDTGDALLVADLSRSQDVRLIVDELRRRSKSELL